MTDKNTSKTTYLKINSPLELIYNKGNIVAQYTYHRKVLRYPLYKVQEDCFNKKTRALKYMPELYDCDHEVDRIEKLAGQVNQAIIELSKTKSPEDSHTIKEIRAYIDEHLTEKVVTSSKYGLINDFEVWIADYKKKKRQEQVRKGREAMDSHPSAKDYTSAKNLLLDYEWDCDDYDNYDEDNGKYVRRLSYGDINDDFIEALIEYCYLPRVSTKTHKYNTEGDMVNKTIQKRLDSLFTFLKSKYGSYPNNIVKPTLDTVTKKIIRLDREELRKLENLELNNERYEKIRDYFLFLCYTGLRYGDFMKLNSTFYDKKANELVLTTQKTSVECRIFLFDKALEIGEKYNFTFKGHTNQSLNRGIKDLLQDHDLFTDDVELEYMKQGRKIAVKPKNEFVTCHTGRKTFISVMIEKGLDVYDLMGMTGHKKRETLKHYVDLFGEERRQKFQKINELLK